MVFAVIVGIVVGAACFAPLVYGMNKARVATPTSNLGHAGALLLGVLISFVVLAVATVVCVMFFRDMALPYTLAEAGGLIAAAVAFSVSKQLRK